MSSKFMNCTATSPMPANRDQMGQHWYHHGAKAKAGEPEFGAQTSSQTWRCPNCGHEFQVTLGRRVTVAQAQQSVARMRARGVVFEGKT